MNILLVDDDDGSLKGMKMALQMLKHTCDAYGDPCEAIRNYSNHTYDLIITDVYMPSMNGFLLAEKVRDINADATIIFMSGQAVSMQNSTVGAATESFFLSKPIDFILLKNLLDQLRC